VAASLADDREWLPVLDQPQGDLVRLTSPVKTRDGRYTEQRAIYAT